MKRQWVLLPEGTEAVFDGKAVCGRCRFDLGRHCHVVVVHDTDEERQILSLLPNSRLLEIERRIGRCPRTTAIRIEGIVGQYRGQNYIYATKYQLL